MAELSFPLEPSDGDTYQGFVYDATAGVWNANTLNATLLNQLGNVNVPTPGDGQYLKYDSATQKWVAADPPTGVTTGKSIAMAIVFG